MRSSPFGRTACGPLVIRVADAPSWCSTIALIFLPKWDAPKLCLYFLFLPLLKKLNHLGILFQKAFFYLNSKLYSKIVTKATHFSDLPLGGFFCNGEIGPVGNTNFYMNILPFLEFVA